MSKKKNKIKLSIDDYTELDIENIIIKVFPSQLTLLAEATIGYFIQNFLIEVASKVEKFATYHSQIYFESIHITLYKLLLDKSGKDALSFGKLLDRIIKGNYKPEYLTKIEDLRKEFNLNVIQKYKETTDVVRIFRNKLISHILPFPIENKGELESQANKAAIDVLPLIEDTIFYYIKFLDIYGYKHELSDYLDLNKLISVRTNAILPKR